MFEKKRLVRGINYTEFTVAGQAMNSIIMKQDIEGPPIKAKHLFGMARRKNHRGHIQIVRGSEREFCATATRAVTSEYEIFEKQIHVL